MPPDFPDVDLESLLGDLRAEDEVWACRPVFLQYLEGLVFRGSPSLMRRKLAALLPSVRGDVPTVLTDKHRTSYCWTTVNQRRAMGDLEPTLVTRGVPLRPSLHSGVFSSKAQSLIRELRQRIPPSILPPEFVARCIRRATQDIATVSYVFSMHRSRRVVLSTQQSIHARAASIVAQNLDLPTVYIPHAPAADNVYYRDIPFNYAALHGNREKQFYEDIGSDTARISVIGSLRELPHVPKQPDREAARETVVVAPSPWDEPVVRAFFDLVVPGLRRPFVVCPHPRSDVALIRSLVPPGTQIIVDRETSDVLAERGLAVVQHSSGVALEAMYLGVPVIDMRLTNLDPPYLFMRTRHVHSVTSSAELMRSLDSIASSHSERSAIELHAYAREWLEPLPPESRRRLDLLLAQELDTDGFVLDRWRAVASH